jgi:hypothetical protein
MRLDRQVIGRVALAGLLAGEPAAALARVGNEAPIPGQGIEVQEDGVDTITRLLETVMQGWNRVCTLQAPPKNMSDAERDVYRQAERMLYGHIIPFVADYPMASDLRAALSDPNEEKSVVAGQRVRKIIPVLRRFIDLRASHPSIVCPMALERRY